METPVGGAGIMVLGMHRSGTSALSHALHLAGADSGARVLSGSRGNEAGHWEDAFAVELHERLLAQFGARWDEPFALPPGWQRSQSAVSASASIQRYLARDRSRHAAWAVKDPRLCLFGGLWREAAEAVGMSMSAVVLVRHPQEVADSLAIRDGLGRGIAYLLWAEHTLSALRIAQAVPSVALRFEDLISDWHHCAARIAQLPAAQSLDFAKAPGTIAGSINSDLRHHVRVGAGDLPTCIARIWERMQSLAEQGGIAQGSADDLAPALDEIDDLLRLYAGDMRDERRKLWERIARLDASSSLEVLQAVPAEMQELRLRVDRHHDGLVSAFSTEVRAMQESRLEAVAASERANASHERLKMELDQKKREAAEQVETARRELTALRADNDRWRFASERLQIVLRSRSWRWTRPLRAAARVLRGDWDHESSRTLRSVTLGWMATTPLLPRKLKQQHLGRALVEAQGSAPIPQAVAVGAELPLAVQDPCRPDVFFWSVIDWHFRTQRPQHLARALAGNGHRVFYISNNFLDDPSPGFSMSPLDADGRLFQINLNLAGAPQIYAAAPLPNQLQCLQASLAMLLEWTGTVGAVSIVQHPYWHGLATMVPNVRLVYDCMDHHAGFDANGAEILRSEADLVRSADLVVVTSGALEQEVSGGARATAVIRNAADYEFFASRPDTIFEDEHGRQVIGYYGAIAEWFDLDLVRAVALQNPTALVLLIGADTAGVGTALADVHNIRLVGEVPYADLPYWLHAFDVCLLPFKRNALTNATNPVKVYEYLAAGKPVVCVDLPEMAQFDGLVDVAGGVNAFTAAVADALGSDPSIPSADERQAFAREQNWDSRADSLDHELRNLDEPRISVVVLTYNNLAYTQACLSSIELHSDYANLEVIVVDNASSDGSKEWLLEWACLCSVAGHDKRLIVNDENLGFAAGNNVGLRESSGEAIVLLNNDTYVTPGWIRTLHAHLARDPQLGLVGPITNNIGNEAKVKVQYSDMDEMIAVAGHLTRKNPGGEIPIRTAAFFCVAMPRCVLDAVGMLDESFGMGFFEDDDYCRRAEQAGYRIACAEDVFVHHHLSASFEKMDTTERKALFNQNKALYERKWGAWKPHLYREEQP